MVCILPDQLKTKSQTNLGVFLYNFIYKMKWLTGLDWYIRDRWPLSILGSRTVNLVAIFMMKYIHFKSYIDFLVYWFTWIHTRLSAQPACHLSMLVCKLSLGPDLCLLSPFVGGQRFSKTLTSGKWLWGSSIPQSVFGRLLFSIVVSLRGKEGGPSSRRVSWILKTGNLGLLFQNP